MKTVEHLTNEQMQAYTAGLLPVGEAGKLSRHLLNCAECRAALPEPSPARLLQIIFAEPETVELHPTKLIRPNYGENEPPRWSGFHPGWVVSSSAMTILLVLIFLAGWFSLTNQSMNSEEPAVLTQAVPPIEIEPPGLKTPDNSNSGERSVSGNLVQPTKSKQPGQEIRKTSRVSIQKPAPRRNLQPLAKKLKVESESPTKVRDKIPVAETRGNSRIGRHSSLLSMEAELNQGGVVLRWQKIPNAVKYHLYLSDDEEILIDEFETEESTSYQLKKTLEPLKTYYWKVIVTLKNGTTVVGPTRKLKFNGERPNQEKSKKEVKKIETRCSEKN